MVHTGREALAKSTDSTFALAILDSELSDQSLVTLGKDLIENYPQLWIIVVPPEKDKPLPSMEGFSPDGYLNRLFSPADMFLMPNELLNREDSGPSFPEDTTSAIRIESYASCSISY